MRNVIWCCVAAAGAWLASAAGALAQANGPDVIVGELIDLAYYGSDGNVHAFAVGTTSCNAGNATLKWVRDTNEHPVIAQNMYRLKGGRFEQIGQSWLKHGFTALQQSECAGDPGFPHRSCINANQGGRALGVGCSDPYVASLNGSQDRLGPRSQVNAASGFYVYDRNAWPPYSGTVARRLQVKVDDLLPANRADARFFVEGQYVAGDDAAAGNKNNNASYREIRFPATTGFTPSFVAATQRTAPALQAWKDADPAVEIVAVDVANDGRFWVACKVTDNGNGTWRYEYAVQNLTSHRSGGSFTVPVPEGSTVTNAGFHDVFYHSGEPYDNTDWAVSVSGRSVSWSSPQPYSENPNSNALRWGTMYNFWFDVDAEPGPGTGMLGLFRPPLEATDPEAVAAPVPTPGGLVVRDLAVRPATNLPALLEPHQDVTLRVRLVPIDDTLVEGSARLHYRYTTDESAPFQSVSLTAAAEGNGWYEAAVPAPGCDGVVSYYFSATGVHSGPVAGPQRPIVIPVGSVIGFFTDTFEEDKGWVGVWAGDTATAGRWERGDPLGTSYNPGTGVLSVQPNDDFTPAGTNCWFTGQGVPGGAISGADVDNGWTTLVSPNFDLSEGAGFEISYRRWFFNGVLSTRTEVLRTEISNDGGQTWKPVKSVGPSAAEASGGWVLDSFRVADFVQPTAQVRVRFIATDMPPDDIVEAAIDDFQITRIGCVCRADWDANGRVQVTDILRCVSAVLAGDARADVNDDGSVGIPDLFAFLRLWFRGCD